MTTQGPILVTGAHRSGTTWVGKILSANQNVVYISEPLNVNHRSGVFRSPTPFWYTYICEDNQSSFLPAFQETLDFNYHLLLEIKSLRSFKDVARMLRDLNWFLKGRLREARPLLKDPFAVFSSPWFAKTLGCQVVILVRHPLAFISSLKRLNWDFDFQDLLNQPFLMRDHLEPFRKEMVTSIETRADIISQGCLLWRMIYTVVGKFRNSHPEFIIVRHEDLSHQPEKNFRELYSTLALDFTVQVIQTIKNSSQSSNPEELSSRNIHAVQLDSKANLTNWKKRLTDKEMIRIRDLTKDVSCNFYPEKIWE